MNRLKQAVHRVRAWNKKSSPFTNFGNRFHERNQESEELISKALTDSASLGPHPLMDPLDFERHIFREEPFIKDSIELEKKVERLRELGGEAYSNGRGNDSVRLQTARDIIYKIAEEPVSRSEAANMLRAQKHSTRTLERSSKQR